jgi:hypothetical protein
MSRCCVGWTAGVHPDGVVRRGRPAAVSEGKLCTLNVFPKLAEGTWLLAALGLI